MKRILVAALAFVLVASCALSGAQARDVTPEADVKMAKRNIAAVPTNEPEAKREASVSVPVEAKALKAAELGTLGVAAMATKGRGGGTGGYGSAPSPHRSFAAPMKMKMQLPASPALLDATSTSESYGHYGINPWVDAAKDRLSTFAVDVDTASYTIARRKILEGQKPPKDAVRVEEMVNYFRYTYPEPKDGALGVHLDSAPSPFTEGKQLLRVGVQARHLSMGTRKPAHLTFLVDVSGSMSSPDKLPLAQRSLRILVDALHDGDTVALVTYAGGVRLVLPPTPMTKKADIHEAIANLSAGGSTSMAGGLELAYEQAVKTLDAKSESRVIVLSDGDANVGASNHEGMLKLIAGKVKEGVTLTTVGFGMGNYKDSTMEQLANKGNGNHHYIDSLMEAKRVFHTQVGSTLEVVAKDVKLQVEFDPAQVKSYRLIGYENRGIADVDFRNDKIDAGEMGAGHTVTALYEVELHGAAKAGFAKVSVRAKTPRGTEASEHLFSLEGHALADSFEKASSDFRFATSVMGAAEIFRESPHANTWSLAKVIAMAQAATPEGNAERQEFLTLLQKSRGTYVSRR